MAAENETRERLSQTDWLDHGLRTLARMGEGALKVGPLAATLGVSRGSFYWHFQDITEFKRQLLETWRERATDQLFRDIDAAITGPARLTQLMTVAFHEDRKLDRAIRAWASIDAEASKMVAAVDASRVDYLMRLLTESGVDRRRALPRAEFLYWAYIGQSAVLHPRHGAITDADIADLSALFASSAGPAARE